MGSHSATFLKHWDAFILLTTGLSDPVVVPIDGSSLSVANVVAHARYRVSPRLSESCVARVQESADFLRNRLEAGDTIYAVNTGVGANADTRNHELVQLQKALLLHLNAGVIGWDGSSPRKRYTRDPKHARESPEGDQAASSSTRISDELNKRASHASTTSLNSTSMPPPWVKAAMLVRTNTLAGGNSGISVHLLHSMMKLIQAEIYPVVPIRGSISASGDLQPLSYIVGALAGSPAIKVFQNPEQSSVLADTGVVGADAALRAANLEPVKFGPKEIISIVNGTAFSAGAAALAMHDGHCFAALAQVLTAMAVESLNGTEESFLPFFGAVRPHPGQIESAHNILAFLKGSQLLKGESNDWGEIGILRQDRYSVRTAAQWIGPSLEELRLAHQQVEVECNSTTDNPLVDMVGQRVVHGGNFQAMAVTAAMDTLRSALQVWGKMLFSQLTEIIHPSFNNGLPPNLTAEDPSRDFLMKGMDTASASYVSELGLLAQRVTPYTVSAEMHNQSINSLALLSARYTFTAIDVFNSLASTALVAFCQAVDLRAIHHHFVTDFEAVFYRILGEHIEGKGETSQQNQAARATQWVLYKRELAQASSLDITARFQAAAESVVASGCMNGGLVGTGSPSARSSPQRLASRLTKSGMSAWTAARDAHTPERALPLMGRASQRMYRFVRQHLAIPFLRATMAIPADEPALMHTSPDASLGSLISRVFDAARDGSLFVPVVECLKEANQQSDGSAGADRAYSVKSRL